MDGGVPESGREPPDIVERASLAVSQPVGGLVLQRGDEGFAKELGSLYPIAENNVAEHLVTLKARLRDASSEEFWSSVTKGLAELTDAQYAFISKRILVDDEDVAVEMPPIGEPGSCLMGAAFYYNDEKGIEGTARNIRYKAYDCPCAYMKHDKVFLIPAQLNDFIVDNPNQANLVVPGEAYMGIPLFADGKCFGHFGVMWSAQGAARRRLSWTFIEMMLHSLEDLILNRLVDKSDFVNSVKSMSDVPQRRVIPHEAVSAAQSLKPYARSLSHELRTPMQGVVGMLDVMYATVQEAAEGQSDLRMRRVFETLKENIEVVQDSSRRAVEAADNVVHAYDMNMGLPVLSRSAGDDDLLSESPKEKEKRPEILVTGNNLLFNGRGQKRRRDSIASSNPSASKLAATEANVSKRRRNSLADVVEVDFAHVQASGHDLEITARARLDPEATAEYSRFSHEHVVCPGLRHTNLRDVLQYVVNDSLRVGGRPDSAIAQEIDGGESIEVRMRSSSGEEKVKIIEWSVDPAVPETIMIDENGLAKMISCVFLNAVKFTEEGRITVTARLGAKSRYIFIKIRDTGPGIPAAFLPNLFKPFSREDDSLTRQSEGLGLGLLVAKGLARRLGGDLLCIHAETSGPRRGTEFEMRVPVTPGDVVSRSGSPFGSPSPSARSRLSADTDIPPLRACRASSHRPSPPQHPDPVTDPHIGRRQPEAPWTPPLRSTKLTVPAHVRTSSPARRNSVTRRISTKKSDFDRNLAKKHPLNFLVAEDNKINRKLLVNMLHKLGYTSVYEAYDGAEAVRQMQVPRGAGQEIDVVLMDLWMPFMDGYEATERILAMDTARGSNGRKPTILAVTADVTDGALERAAKVGMKGFMTKPYKLMDLERLIVEYCAREEMDDFPCGHEF